MYISPGAIMPRNAWIIGFMFLALFGGVPKNTGVQVIQVIHEPQITIDEKELMCLAKNIYYEAPVEKYEGKLAVATVTMNRLRHRQFPNSVCDVVYQRNTRGCQFSWTCGPKAPFDSTLFQESYKIARNVLTNNIHVPILKNALYFHNTSVSPDWSFARPITQIGNHIFYEPRKPTT
jgi:spore germination cell wall hydrolase CwlJ-like protein